MLAHMENFCRFYTLILHPFLQVQCEGLMRLCTTLAWHLLWRHNAPAYTAGDYWQGRVFIRQSYYHEGNKSAIMNVAHLNNMIKSMRVINITESLLMQTSVTSLIICTRTLVMTKYWRMLIWYNDKFRIVISLRGNVSQYSGCSIQP